MPTIRPFTPEDYPQVIELYNRVWPEFRTTSEAFRHKDDSRDPIIKFGRWIAEIDGRIIGMSYHTQYIDLYKEDEARAEVGVDVAHERNGIGLALLHEVEGSARLLGITTLKASIREDKPSGIAFAQKHGFVEYSRRWESLLNIPAFDPALYSELEPNLAAAGIHLKSYADLANDPKRDHKFYLLQNEIDADVPLPDTITPMTFEQFKKERLQDPRFVPEATTIAVHNNEYVGLNSLLRIGDVLWVDLTGTTRAYRRQGIALALKVRGIEFARQLGYQEIGVTNDLTNEGMLAINQKLGFMRGPTQLLLKKQI